MTTTDTQTPLSADWDVPSSRDISELRDVLATIDLAGRLELLAIPADEARARVLAALNEHAETGYEFLDDGSAFAPTGISTTAIGY